MSAKPHSVPSAKQAIERGKLNALKRIHKGKSPSQINKADVDAYWKQKMIVELGLEGNI